MIINDDILRRDTIGLLKAINQQIAEIENEARRLGKETYQMRDNNGNWVMNPLLLAKTQVYAILVNLQIK